MPYTKIINVVSSVSNVIDYVSDEKKTYDTNKNKFVTSYMCNADNPLPDFNDTMNLHLKYNGHSQDNKNKGYHIIQNIGYDSRKYNSEQIHEMGVKLAEKFIGGNYQWVVYTHFDTEFVHNHIIFNSVSLDASNNYKKFKKHKYVWKNLVEINNDIARDYGIKTIEINTEKSYSFNEREMNKNNKTTYRQQIESIIIETIKESKNYFEFKYNMKKRGVIVDDTSSVHLTYKFVDGRSDKKFRGNRLSKINSYDKVDVITKLKNSNNEISNKDRVVNNYYKNKYVTKKEITKLISIINYISKNNINSKSDLENRLNQLMQDYTMNNEKIITTNNVHKKLDIVLYHLETIEDPKLKNIYYIYKSKKLGKFYYNKNKNNIDKYQNSLDELEKIKNQVNDKSNLKIEIVKDKIAEGKGTVFIVKKENISLNKEIKQLKNIKDQIEEIREKNRMIKHNIDHER